MPRDVDGAPDLEKSARHPGGRLVVDDEQRLDPVVAIAGEPLTDLAGIDAAPPGAGHELDVEAEPAGHLGPVLRELADVEREYCVTGRERVDQRRFPGAAPGRRIDDDRRFRLK